MCWVIPPIQGLTELTVPPEINAKSVGAIDLQANGRLVIYLYDEQMPLDPRATEPTKVVTGKIIGSIADLPLALGKLVMCLTVERSPGIAPDAPFKPHLVR